MTLMKQIRSLISFKTVCLMIAGFLAACGPDGSTVPKSIAPPPAVDQGEDPDPVETADLDLATPLPQTKVALLLPFTGPAGDVATALRQSVTLALFDAYDPSLILLPFDTKSTADGAELAANEAIEQGADIILGPLFSEHARRIAPTVLKAGLMMLSFSNDPEAAGPGSYILGYQVSDEIKRVVHFARDRGYGTFSALVPDTVYGDQVQDSFARSVTEAGGILAAFERFIPAPDGFDAPVRRLGNYDARRRAYQREVASLEALDDDLADEIVGTLKSREVLGEPDFDTVLVAEGGELLRGLAPILPYYEIDPKRVKLLGTGLWNDPGLMGEPPLQGAWFAGPDPAKPTAFYDRFERVFGGRPPNLVSVGYDAMAVVAFLVRDARISDRPAFAREAIERPEGFSGIDGPVRFLSTGVNERMFAVLEVNRRGVRIADPAPMGFPSFGYMVMSPTESPEEGR